MNAETLMLFGGLGAFMLTIYWLRSRYLREKYAIGWLLVSFLALLCGLWPSALMSIAVAWQLSYPAAVLFIALVVGYLFSFSVSIALSRHYRQLTRLTQDVALLECQLRELIDGKL